MDRRRALALLGAAPFGILLPSCKRSEVVGAAPAAPVAPLPTPLTQPAGQPVSTPVIGQTPSGLDVTFLVTADTHFGIVVRRAGTPDPVPVDELNEAAVREMHAMAGRRWPEPIGGRVDPPRGLLVAGDLTEHGRKSEWEGFDRCFVRNGIEGKAAMPVFESVGNHDRTEADLVTSRVVDRHGSTRYSWDWDGLHMICLGEAPDNGGLAWLQKDLAATGPRTPVVVYLHYPLLGPWSKNNWFGDTGFRERLHAALAKANVVAMFHGHYHATGHYRWEGRDVFTPGSPKNRWRSFLVARVTNDRLTVASWQYESQAWWWWVSRQLSAMPGELLVASNDLGRVKPMIPYPTGSE